ncbi:translation initiation factor IF-3 [Luteibacter sp. 329MFSha]|uniref:translation initiation factor IF-3 n=1 Tax=Luteibacter sp. 329MFSha TaxID=1798239 RepID=UPI0031B62A2B
MRTYPRRRRPRQHAGGSVRRTFGSRDPPLGRGSGIGIILLEDSGIATTDNKGNRKNNEIRVPRVRVLGAEGEQMGIMDTRDAIRAAEDLGMDLVEIQPNGDPPVCKIMDYGKFKFEAQKKASAAKKKQKQVEIKEVKFRPVTDEGDYQIKLRKMREFLEEGDKVKVTIRFRGREMSHQDLGQNLARRVQTDIGEDGVVESFPRLEGRQMVMMIGPKKKA